MTYFKDFPYLPYWFTESDQPFPIVHVLRRFKFVEIIKGISSNWNWYRIEDGETAESVSKKFYKTDQYYWVIMVFNNIINPFDDWPRSEVELRKYVTKKYGDGNEYNVHHYVDADGDWDVPEIPNPLFSVSNFDYEYELNENRRYIQIPTQITVGVIIEEVKKIFEEVV